MATADLLVPPFDGGDRLSREEFLRRWEAHPEIKRAELIGGTVYMPSPVSFDHGDMEVDVPHPGAFRHALIRRVDRPWAEHGPQRDRVERDRPDVQRLAVVVPGLLRPVRIDLDPVPVFYGFSRRVRVEEVSGFRGETPAETLADE